MKYCPNCGKANTDGANFCQSCGAKFEAQLSLEQVSSLPEREGDVVKKKAPGCLMIGLWVIFLPIMLLIHSIKKKKTIWYILTGIVWAAVLGLVISFVIFYNSSEQVAIREQAAARRYQTQTKNAEFIHLTQTQQSQAETKTASIKATDNAIRNAEKTMAAETRTVRLQTESVEKTTAAETKIVQKQTENAIKNITVTAKAIINETENAEKTITAETRAVIKQTEAQSKLLTSTAHVFAKETEAQQKTISAAQTQTATFLPSSTPTITRTPTISPTPTVTPLPWQATGTANAELIAFKKGYEAIYWKELDTYPDNYIGRKVQVTGRASQINSSTEMNAYYGGTYEMFYVISDVPFSGIYENTGFTVYGTVYGKHCGSNALGGTVCLTVIDADLIEKN